MDSALHKLEQAAKATADIQGLIRTARTRIDSGFTGANAFGVLIEPAAVELHIREAFEALANAYAILVQTTWPNGDDYKQAIDEERE